MPQILTPILAIASAGLIENKGLTASANLATAINSYNSLVITSNVQACLGNANVSSNVKTALTSIPSCLTGIVSANLRTTVPDSIVSEFNFNNLIADVGRQRDLVMTNGAVGLASIIPRIQSTCVNAFDLRGTYQRMTEGSFDDFGITVGSYTDTLTGGVSSQFSRFEGGLNNSAVREMLTQLGKFGTMFNIARLSQMHEPYVLCQNLINQGFYLVNELLTRGGLDISDLENTDPTRILAVLQTIDGVELSAIVTVTEFQSTNPITNLAQVLDAGKLFGPQALTAAGGSLAALSNKLANIGGSYRSFRDLSNTFLNLRTTPTPRMTSQQSLAAPGLFANAVSRLGSGDGVFSNPNIYDYIGVITGEGYVDDINYLISVQNQILNTSQGIVLKNAVVQAAQGTGSVQAINNAVSALTAISSINTLLNTGNAKFADIFNRLLKERKNSNAAQIDYRESPGSADNVTGFVLDLHTAWNDPRDLRYSEFIKKIVTDDIFGEAISSGIDEGFNLAKLTDKSVSTYTKIDPVEYSTVVKSRPIC